MRGFPEPSTEDNYNESNFYQNDEQCVQGVNYLYNSPWYDFQRGLLKSVKSCPETYTRETALLEFYGEWYG